MPLPGDFSLTTYTSLAKKLGIPSIPAFSLPNLTLVSPKALKNVLPQLPQVALNPAAIVDQAATQAASGAATALDSAENGALAATALVNPITGL